MSLLSERGQDVFDPGQEGRSLLPWDGVSHAENTKLDMETYYAHRLRVLTQHSREPNPTKFPAVFSAVQAHNRPCDHQPSAQTITRNMRCHGGSPSICPGQSRNHRPILVRRVSMIPRLTAGTHHPQRGYTNHVATLPSRPLVSLSTGCHASRLMHGYVYTPWPRSQ